MVFLSKFFFCFYIAAVSGIVTCCNSAVLFCSIHSSLSIFSTRVSEVTVFFSPGWIIFFASEKRAIGLKMASILITMVTFLLLFLASYPQTALLLLVRDYEPAWRGQMWYLERQQIHFWKCRLLSVGQKKGFELLWREMVEVHVLIQPCRCKGSEETPLSVIADFTAFSHIDLRCFRSVQVRP
jgi:hypothetical protein